ncbi:MAG TPA: heavy metal translocating P-type ATPase [Candidatus Methylomirabilis sp.]|nr:heavy metal translocating P-type ATPase [Candidatus Methylomirabilis sp.]
MSRPRIRRRRHASRGGVDVTVGSPEDGRLQMTSRYLFADPAAAVCQRFVARLFEVAEVRAVEIRPARAWAEIEYVNGLVPSRSVVGKIARHLRNGSGGADPPYVNSPRDLPVAGADGGWRVERHGPVLSTWEIVHELPDRIRVRNRLIRGKPGLCGAIEAALMRALGVDSYRTSARTASVLIRYDRRKIARHQLLQILDQALIDAEDQEPRDAANLDFPLCTASLGLATVSQFRTPALLPMSAAMFLYSVVPTFRNARRTLRERRLGVDVLDSLVVVACLLTGQIFAGAVLAWCLSAGRALLQKTRDDSRRRLLNVFGKQARFVLVWRDGMEVETPLEKLQPGDTVVVNTGEVVPVDGEVTEGTALVDQHLLTGESAPAEKGVGDTVFASTVMLAGKLLVRVTSAGAETTAARISQILNDTAGYTLRSQSRGEELADKAAIPTLALGVLGAATVGIGGATAILNSDFGTGIRMAAPLGMLTSLGLCAQQGILVKDGRALELMSRVDTILFDKTGTLTLERPEVGRVIVCDGLDESGVLRYAAAAEQKFTHPIARAILDRVEALRLALPPIDESAYHVGYGITVGIEGRTVSVGSARFMAREGLDLPRPLTRAMEEAHAEGNSLIVVVADRRVVGGIELRASCRPEAREMVAGLRQRGIDHLAIISGDHERPTRQLAELLEMDRYFAEVLPSDKARYVELLQREGRTVCFVGDGINDSIALKRAEVSISLRGASTIATDTAQIVFMDERLSRILDLRDIARDLERNVRRSWHMILWPNGVCIAGAFFLGFGILESMLFNNVSALFALGNGLRPLRKVAELQAQREVERDLVRWREDHP